MQTFFFKCHNFIGQFHIFFFKSNEMQRNSIQISQNIQKIMKMSNDKTLIKIVAHYDLQTFILHCILKTLIKTHTNIKAADNRTKPRTSRVLWTPHPLLPPNLKLLPFKSCFKFQLHVLASIIPGS